MQVATSGFAFHAAFGGSRLLPTRMPIRRTFRESTYWLGNRHFGVQATILHGNQHFLSKSLELTFQTDSTYRLQLWGWLFMPPSVGPCRESIAGHSRNRFFGSEIDILECRQRICMGIDLIDICGPARIPIHWYWF